MARQIPLTLVLPSGATFGNFVVGPNQEVFNHALRIADGSVQHITLIWGGAGTGKSHLLQAVGRAVTDAGQSAAYLSLNSEQKITPSVLEGLDSMSLVCVDDIEGIAGSRDWEQALFNLYNCTEQSGTRLLIGSGCPLADMGIELADLRSRLSSGPVFQLRALNDEQRRLVLQDKAQAHGFEISSEVAEYLLRRYPRDMHALVNLISALDVLTLTEKRRVTIPFIKTVLEKVR